MKAGLNVLVLACRVQRQSPWTHPEGTHADQELPSDCGGGVRRGGDLRGTKGQIFFNSQEHPSDYPFFETQCELFSSI